MVKIALQAGAMKPAMMELFRGAYLPIVQTSDASFDGVAGPYTVRFMKSATIPEEVVAGQYTCGITGEDVIFGSGLGNEVEVITELPLSRRSDQPVRVVLVGQKGSGFPVSGDIIYVDCEYEKFADAFMQTHQGVTVRLMLGTSEEKVRSPGDFAIVATETGASLRANGLEIKQVLMKTHMILFVRKGIDSEQRAHVTELGWLLRGVADAHGRVLLKMNIIEDAYLNDVISRLPALGTPTVMPLAGGGHAVETVVQAGEAATLVPALKRAGASAIITQDLHMVVL